MSRGLKRPPSLLSGGAHVYALGLILFVAAIFRLWHLPSLPPGLAPGEANLGLAAYQLSHHGVWPTFSAVDGQTPLMVILLALEQMVFGLSPWVLRIVPALCGVASVGIAYLLGRDLVLRRTGLIAAAFIAVSPWAVTLNRSVSAAALVPLLLALSLWTGLRFWRNGSRKMLAGFIITFILEILLGPAGWAVIFVSAVGGITASLTHHRKGLKTSVIAATGLIVGVIPALLLYLFDHARLGLAVTTHDLAHGISQTLLAFLFHGDDSYQTNLGGQPLLNVFAGIMLVAGLLVVVTRFKQLSYRVAGVVFVAALIPSMVTLSSTPSASRLGLALVPALILASIGTGYMLEIWYSTFPINSAARLTGQTAIIVLVALSAVQGYNQYFVAWAQSSATYGAYSERALAMANWATKQTPGSGLELVVEPSDQTALNYGLLKNKNPIIVVANPQKLGSFLSPRPLRLALASPDRDVIVPQLRSTAAGGTLVPHLSLFDQSELFYSYEVR